MSQQERNVQPQVEPKQPLVTRRTVLKAGGALTLVSFLEACGQSGQQAPIVPVKAAEVIATVVTATPETRAVSTPTSIATRPVEVTPTPTVVTTPTVKPETTRIPTAVATADVRTQIPEQLKGVYNGLSADAKKVVDGILQKGVLENTELNKFPESKEVAAKEFGIEGMESADPKRWHKNPDGGWHLEEAYKVGTDEVIFYVVRTRGKLGETYFDTKPGKDAKPYVTTGGLWILMQGGTIWNEPGNQETGTVLRNKKHPVRWTDGKDYEAEIVRDAINSSFPIPTNK